MGEFKKDVEDILDRIKEKAKHGHSNEHDKNMDDINEGINTGDLPDVVADVFGRKYNPGNSVQQINCYPGKPNGECCKIALFFALGKPYIRTKRGNYNCRSAIEKVVKHMQGYCHDITRTVIIVTDN